MEASSPFLGMAGDFPRDRGQAVRSFPTIKLTDQGRTSAEAISPR